MSYYMKGDYYRGDYYRGDPGIGSFFKKAGKLVGGVVGGGLGFLVGGPAGAVAGAKLGSTIGGIGQGAAALIPAASAISPGPGFNVGPIRIDPMAVLPGGAPLISFGPQASGDQCPKGFHLDKATRSRCVRNRSMNVLNPRALRRGIRRAEGFEKIARRTVNALRSGPKKFKSKARKR